MKRKSPLIQFLDKSGMDIKNSNSFFSYLHKTAMILSCPFLPPIPICLQLDHSIQQCHGSGPILPRRPKRRFFHPKQPHQVCKENFFSERVFSFLADFIQGFFSHFLTCMSAYFVTAYSDLVCLKLVQTLHIFYKGWRIIAVFYDKTDLLLSNFEQFRKQNYLIYIGQSTKIWIL